MGPPRSRGLVPGQAVTPPGSGRTAGQRVVKRWAWRPTERGGRSAGLDRLPTIHVAATVA